MQISIDIDARKIMQAFKRAPNIMQQEIRTSIKEATQLIQREARANHRFNTQSGQLERSIQTGVRSTGLSASVYLEKGLAVYGPRIHQGYGRWSPDPFLYEAAKKKEDKAVKVIEDGINRAIKKAGL